jgi:flagellar motor switch protein FliN/FliY
MRFGFCCGRSRCADNNPVPVLHADQPAAEAPSLSQGELQRILHLEVPVIVKLAERKLSMSEVLRLGVGAIIEFAKSSDEPLELLINNKPIGVGEAVKVGENFGLRITQVGDVKSIIKSMGGT